MSDENFIPWSQIEPVVRDGFTTPQTLGFELLRRLGLPKDGYALELIGEPLPFNEAIRRGCRVIPMGSAVEHGYLSVMIPHTQEIRLSQNGTAE